MAQCKAVLYSVRTTRPTSNHWAKLLAYNQQNDLSQHGYFKLETANHFCKKLIDLRFTNLSNLSWRAKASAINKNRTFHII